MMGESLVFIERCKLSLQQIDCLNSTSSVCKISAVLQVDHNNSQIATKIAIANPLADASESVISLQSLVENCVSKPTARKEYRDVIKGLLNNLLELRILLPPVYNFDPRYFIVNTETNETKIIISDSLCDRENSFIPVGVSKDDLLFKSPEELAGNDKQLTTPFWAIGVILYMTQYGRHPFETGQKPKVMENMIRKYPVIFPDEVDSSLPPANNDLKALIRELLTKDPAQRLGSDRCELEILQHAYFE